MRNLHSLRSIRWQLPISYAGIAFLAAVVSGVVLLTALRNHYAGIEHAYLDANAQGFSIWFAETLTDAPDLSDLDTRVTRLGFFWNMRIQVLDQQQNVIIDSGSPAEWTVALGPAGSADMLMFSPLRVDVTPASNPQFIAGDIFFFDADTPGRAPLGIYQGSNRDTNAPLSAQNGSPYYSITHSPLGLRLSAPMQIEQNDNRRSDQWTAQNIYAADGQPLGTVVLSEGPAYGMAILDSVAQTWLLASACAVLLAAAAGWLISRRISTPLLALTRTTQRMASGELTARTTTQRGDELGTLAHAFNDMAERIETTINTLRRFAADAAHELYTPLAALRTNVELAAEECRVQSPRTASTAIETPVSAAEDATPIARALAQIERLQALANDLLDLSHIESDPRSAPQSCCDLRALVAQVSELYASRAEQSELDYHLTLPNAPVPLVASEQQMHRVLANLLDNALKFTPPGGSIAVSLQHNTQQIILSIEDTGIGIPADDLPHLFERFRRGRNTAAYPGSGLGLAIVRAIVRAHHGSVSAESSAQGTRIRILLPPVQPTASPTA